MENASSSQQAALSETPTLFTQEELSKLNSEFETGGVEKVQPLLEKKVKELDNTELNIAVTGDTGAGKSTFINAMRGLRKQNVGAAAVGTTETTMEPNGYPHPNLPNVRYWDLPGIGTTRFTAGSYLKEMQFEKYDFFIIVSAGRFRENDAKLAKEIKRLGKEFYFVLFKKNMYDFPRFMEALADGLPNIKESIFVLALPNISVQIIWKKREVLEKRIWMLAIMSAGVGAIPVTGLSAACDMDDVNARKCLCLDDAALRRVAERTGKSVEDLKAAAQSPLLGEITTPVIVRMGLGAVVVAVSVVETALYLVPGIGSVIGGGTSFLMTYSTLSKALQLLVECAEKVLAVAKGAETTRQAAINQFSFSSNTFQCIYFGINVNWKVSASIRVSLAASVWEGRFSPGRETSSVGESGNVSENLSLVLFPVIFTKEEIKTGGVKKIKHLLQKKVKELDNTELNIAVTGDTGAGKSTFINAMRGLRSEDEGAAAVGTTETTMEPTGYPHPNLPNVRYWDLLGIGSRRFTADSYLTEMQFKKYDFFNIVSACRFTENDANLAKEIKRLGKEFYFVRSKIDADLDSMQQQRDEFDEDAEMGKTRSDCVSQLGKAGIPDPNVFLISSFMKNMHDFPRLMEALEYEEPCLCPGPSQTQCGDYTDERRPKGRVFIAKAWRCILQWVKETWGATFFRKALKPDLHPTMEGAPSVHAPTRCSQPSSCLMRKASCILNASSPRVVVANGSEYRYTSFMASPSR
ncbi:interferon-inducible GTPase 5-like [Amblyraja radiata]|uniref:interferon-inducible GTPase 5-like n=1 Tax=Amblyraja radiata TaxID=386614 RepID=UPI001402D860|nr:interferon-inducible GTPase 5-like [Amblyraja radiata]